MEHGFKWWLLHLLVVRALTQSCRALNTAPQQVQLPAVDPAKQFAVDFRMQATSYAAYMMVRDYQTSDASHCDYPGLAADVCKWSSKDAGWERLVRAESMVAIAHQAFRAAEYDEAIIALEESLALRLFAYTDQKTLDRWQQGLVMPGSQYRHDKKAIADSLVLRSDCLVQLARANQDVAELTEATELLQLAAAELQAAQALNADSQAAISMRMTSIAALATELLPRLSPTRLKELLDQHGISCSSDGGSSGSNATSGSSPQPPEWCDSPGELLLHLVPLLRLPVCLVGPKGKMLSSSLGCGSSIQQQGGQQQQQQQHRLRKGQVPTVQPVNAPFDSFGSALLQKPCEVVAHYLQRMFFRLLSVVPVEYMRDLHVSCQRTDSRSRCISYLPTWVTAQAVTIDKRTGRAHVTGPSSCAVDSSSNSGAHAGSCSAAQKSRQQGSASSGTCQANSQGQLQQQGALELCGFLHIRSLAPGLQLPTADGQLTQEQHESLRRAADAAAVHHGQASVQPAGSCSAGSTGGSSSSGCGGGNGVYYYYFPDIPAVLDHVVLAQGQEDSMYLLSQLDSLTHTHSLKRWLQKRNKGSDCSEAALLEGRAPQSCSVLVPSIGDCSAGHLASTFSSASALLGQSGKHMQPPQARAQAAAVAAATAAATAAAAPSPAGVASCGCNTVVTTCRSVSTSSSRCSGPDATSGDSSDRGASKRGRRHRSDTDGDASDGDLVTSSSGSSRRNSNGSKRRRSKQSTDPYLDAPPYPHVYNSFARVDREIADRQLLEQMNKIERDKRQPHHDGPLIPLTLGMLVLICCLPFIVSKFRRSSSRQQQQQQQGAKGWAPWRGAAGVAGRPAVSASPIAPGVNSASSAQGAFPAFVAANAVSPAAAGPAAAAAGPAAGLSSGSGGSSTVDSSHMQRLAAAAVKAALSSNDLELMEGALRQAEGVGMSNTANCVRLKELLAKRKRQAQQAKRQEQMRQQEQARRGRKGRKGGQDQGTSASAGMTVAQQQQQQQQQQGLQQGKGSTNANVQQQNTQQAGEKKSTNRLSAWFKRVFMPSARKAQSAAEGSGSGDGRTLGRVSDSSSTAAAAAADGGATGLSRSCSISSSRSASSSMISSSPSVMGSAQLQLLAVNDSSSSRGCSPATSVSCSPQSSIGISHSDTATTQQQQQRDKSSKRSNRGSVTVAVAARGAKQQQQQEQQAVDPDVAELASSLLAVREATLSISRSSSPASSPQAVAVTSSGFPAASGRTHKQQQQPKGAHGTGTDVTSPRCDGASGNLPIYSPPSKQQQHNSPAKAAAAAGGGKGGKGKQQSRTVSVSAAAAGYSPELGHSTPKAVITAADSGGGTRGGSGTYIAATAAGVEPPATPAGAATASPLRADRHQQQQQQLPPPWQQQQQQQQRSSTRTAMSWLEAALPSKQRAAAVSEDGSMSNSSSCLNSPAGAQQRQQQGGAAGAGAASTQNTPTKAKLNPKAAPYNPKGYSPSPTTAGAAAANALPGGWHSPAGNVPGLILTPSPQSATAAAGSTGSSSWQQQQQQSMLAARAGGNGGNFSAAAGVASMLQQQDGGAVGRRLSCNGLVEPSAVTGMGGGLPPPGNLMGGISAAAAGLHGAQNMQQMLLHQQHYGLLSPHTAATLQQQQAAAAWQQQQQLRELHREEQLMAMLSALSPEEASAAAAAAAAVGLGGAGGSAPPLGTAGSSGSSGVTGGVRIDSSTSSSGEYRGHVLGPMASHGLGWMSSLEGQGVGLGRPPLGPTGLAGALSSQQQQQQQFQRPSRISLPQDLDSQLPPGFSAESFTSGPPGSTSSSVGGAPGPGAFSPAAAATPGSLASPASAVGMPVGSAAMLAGGSNPWSYVPAQGKPAMPLLIVSEAATAGPLGMQGYGGQTMSMSMDMGQSLHIDMDMGQSLHMDLDHHVVAAAAATSTNVAELVLGSSPPPNIAHTLHGVEELFYRANTSSSAAAAASGSNGGAGGSNGGSGMTAADADAHAARLADEMTAGVLD